MNEDKATRYQRLRRRASVANAALAVAGLVVLLVTGWSAALRDAALELTAGAFVPALACYVLLLSLAGEALQLPLAVYQGVVLERRYGLSTEPAWRWAIDRAKTFGVALVISIGAASIVYALLRWNPQAWWMAAAACFAVLIVALAQLAPVLLLPLFYRIRPLDRPALAERLIALAKRARTPVVGVFEWQLSDRTRKANAALAGLGSTRRILLSDTLLAQHTDDEVEVVLAHELAHHVHHDLWRAIAFEAAFITLALYVADRVLDASVGRFGVAGKGDMAGLPLLVLAGGAVGLVLLPLANALSRRHERRADAYALDMTRNAAAFTSAMKRLGAQNLAEERPSRVVEMLFHSHPPIAARLEAARTWEARRR